MDTPIEIPEQFRAMDEAQLAQVVVTLRNPLYSAMLKAMAKQVQMEEFVSVLMDKSIPPEKCARVITILRDCAIEGQGKEVMLARMKADPLVSSVQILPF